MYYKTKGFQEFFDSLLDLAEDTSSELYHQGKQRRGAIHRCAFWDGFNDVERSANVTPGTLSDVSFQAGKEFKRRCKKNGKVISTETTINHTVLKQNG